MNAIRLPRMSHQNFAGYTVTGHNVDDAWRSNLGANLSEKARRRWRLLEGFTTIVFPAINAGAILDARSQSVERDNPSAHRAPQSQMDILGSRWNSHSFEFVSKPTIKMHPLDGLMNIIRHRSHSVPSVECLDLGKLVNSGLKSLRDLLNQATRCFWLVFFHALKASRAAVTASVISSAEALGTLPISS